MAFKCGSTEPLDSSIIYSFIPKHRIPRNKASQWVISCVEEYNLAKESYLEEFKAPDNDRYYWNVKRENNELVVLGKQDSNEEFIGRFDLYANGMHGYPIDYTVDSRQKPNNHVLKELLNKQKLNKKEMLRISCGKAL